MPLYLRNHKPCARRTQAQKKPSLKLDKQKALERLERGETLMRYVFVLSYRGTTLRLQLRDGLVRDEFIALGKKPTERTRKKRA